MPKKRNIEMRNKIKSLHADGLSIYAISKELGKSESAISGYFKRMGLKSHFKKKHKLLDQDLIQSYVDDGLGFFDIMAKVNCGGSTLRRAMERAGYFSDESIKARAVFVSEKLYDECIGSYDKTKKVRDMAENAGVSVDRMRKFLKNNNLPYASGRKTLLKDRVQELLDKGYSPDEVLLEGLSSDYYIAKILRDKGYVFGCELEHKLAKCLCCQEQYTRTSKKWEDTVYCDVCKETDKVKFFIYINNKNKTSKGVAKKADIEYELSRGYLYDLRKKQEGKCAYTGNILIHTISKNKKRNYPTIDRIDSNKGYIKGNVLWVCDQINAMKNNCTLEELKTYMPLVHERIVYWLPIIKGL